MNVRKLIAADNAVAWLIGATAAAAIGVAGSAAKGGLPGSEPLSVEDVVDAVGAMGFGVLGVALLRRRRAEGLGRLLLALAALAGAVWLTGGLANVLATDGTPSTSARMLALLSAALFVPLFVTMAIGPLLLFPTGTLPSRHWRPVVWLAMAATLGGMLSILVKPGDLDEDVPAWGDNPIGIPGLAGVLDFVEAAALVALLVCVVGGAAAVLIRLVMYRGPRRRQVLWFLAGAAPMLVGLFTDVGTSAVAQTVSAVVIFGGLIGGMGWALLGGPALALEREQAASEYETAET